MICADRTRKGDRCKNLATIDDVCEIHYTQMRASYSNKEEIKKWLSSVDKKLKQQYDNLCIILSTNGLNRSLIKLILEYRTSILADMSWYYDVMLEYALTFDSIGDSVICGCPACNKSGMKCCVYGTCNHREINYRLGHCIYCACKDCICELSNFHDKSKNVMSPDYETSCYGTCVSCKNW